MVLNAYACLSTFRQKHQVTLTRLYNSLARTVRTMHEEQYGEEPEQDEIYKIIGDFNKFTEWVHDNVLSFYEEQGLEESDYCLDVESSSSESEE